MEIKLVNGDYVPDGLGGVERLEGDKALLGRVLYRLTAHRGGLPLLPGLGSRLYLLPGEPAAQRLSAARQYAVEALAEEPVTVEDVTLEPAGEGRCAVTVYLSGASEFSVTVTI